MLRASLVQLSRGTMASAAMMGRRLRKDIIADFISSSYRVWGSRFDYSLINYKHPNVPVKILCKQHGIFAVTPKDHLHKQRGCPNCSIERRVRRQDTQQLLPPSPELGEFMKRLSPGTKSKRPLIPANPNSIPEK
jgi:hypothetical protein